jgi:hypothetical protein
MEALFLQEGFDGGESIGIVRDCLDVVGVFPDCLIQEGNHLIHRGGDFVEP